MWKGVVDSGRAAAQTKRPMEGTGVDGANLNRREDVPHYWGNAPVPWDIGRIGGRS